MKAALLSLCLGVVATTLWHASHETAQVFGQAVSAKGQPTPRNIMALQGIIALQGPEADGRQLLVLVDTDERTIGAYHIDLQSGQVALRCVRRFGWDMQMDEYNGAEPSPEHIKALIRSR